MTEMLLQELHYLRDRLTDTIVAKDELLTISYQHLSALYMNKIGKYETQLHESEYEYVRLKKKLELIKLSQKTSGKDVDLYSIDKRLDKDYKDVQLRIDARKKISEDNIRSLHEATASLNKYMKIKSSYKKVVRKLHPDILKNPTKQEIRSWTMAHKAYEDLDLQKLESYEISSSYIDEEDEMSEEELRVEIGYLVDKIEENVKYMDSLSRVHPYNKKSLLADESKVSQEKERLQNFNRDIEEKISQLEDEILLALID